MFNFRVDMFTGIVEEIGKVKAIVRGARSVSDGDGYHPDRVSC